MVALPPALRSEELLRLREGLELVYESLEGEATLESMEDWLHLTCRGDGRGHVEVSGTLVDQLTRCSRW